MKLEKILSVSFVVGLVLRLLHWPGGSLLIILSLGLIAMSYFPFAVIFFRTPITKKQNVLFSVLSGFSFSFVPVGVMFKFQYWLGANNYLSLGAFFSIIVLVIAIVLRKKIESELALYYQNIIRRSIVLSLTAILLFLTPTALLIKINYWNDPQLAKLKQQHYLNPGNEEYKMQHDKYIMNRDSIENMQKP